MLFVSGSVNVYPPCFYRKPETIKEDIRKISARISEINEMLNVREMLAEYLNEGKTFCKEDAAALSELLEFAKEALDEFTELNSALDDLKRELIASITMVG